MAIVTGVWLAGTASSERSWARPHAQGLLTPTPVHRPPVTATPWSVPGMGWSSRFGCATTGSVAVPKAAVEDGEEITATISVRIDCPAKLAGRTAVLFAGTRSPMQLPAVRAAFLVALDQLVQAGVGQVAIVRAELGDGTVAFRSGDAALRALRNEVAALPAATAVSAEQWATQMSAARAALLAAPDRHPLLLLIDGTESRDDFDGLWPTTHRALLDLQEADDSQAVILDLSATRQLLSHIESSPGLASARDNVHAVGARPGHASDLPVFVWRVLTGLGGPITGYHVQSQAAPDLHHLENGSPLAWQGRALSTTLELQFAYPVVARHQLGRGQVGAQVFFTRRAPLGENVPGVNPSAVCVYPSGRPEACAPPTAYVTPTPTATPTLGGLPTASPTARPTRTAVPTMFPDWAEVEPVQCTVDGEHSVRGNSQPQGGVLSDELTVRITCPELLPDRHAAVVLGSLDTARTGIVRLGLRQLVNALADAGESDISLRAVGDPAVAAFTVPRDAAALEAAVTAITGRSPDSAEAWRAALNAAVNEALTASPGRRPMLVLLDGEAPTGDRAAALAALELATARLRAADGVVVLADLSPDGWLKPAAKASGIDRTSLVYFRPFGVGGGNLWMEIRRWAASVNAPLEDWEATTHFPTLLDVDDGRIDPPSRGANTLGALWTGTASGHTATLRVTAGGRTLAPLVDTTFLTTLRYRRGIISSYEERFWSAPICIHPPDDPLWCTRALGASRRVFLPWAERSR